jgi:hypothetical protein
VRKLRQRRLSMLRFNKVLQCLTSFDALCTRELRTVLGESVDGREHDGGDEGGPAGFGDVGEAVDDVEGT